MKTIHLTSYSVSDIQDYFAFIIKTQEKYTDNSPIRTDVNKIEKRITFKTKSGYYIELLIHEAMKLLGSAKKKVNWWR